MTLFCQRCGEKFDSLIIDQNIAMREVTDRVVKHCRIKHQEVMAKLQQVKMTGEVVAEEEAWG